jgi:hypothetical protein
MENDRAIFFSIKRQEFAGFAGRVSGGRIAAQCGEWIAVCGLIDYPATHETPHRCAPF